MLTGLDALENTDWSKLNHAYGRATDTPAHLRHLLEPDAEARHQAEAHLYSAILHQGTPWTATGPVARVVAGLLDDPRLDEGEPIRAALLLFLVDVVSVPENLGLGAGDLEAMKRKASFDLSPWLEGEEDEDEDEPALFENEDAMEAFYAQSVLGCIEVAPLVMDMMLHFLSSPTASVRVCASMGAAALARTEAFGHLAARIREQTRQLANAASDSDERSAHVLALGEVGYEPLEFLDDPAPGVRLCAALAPTLAAHPAAVGVLLDALEQHADQINGWFEHRPPQFPIHPRLIVVGRVLERVADFDRLVNAAVEVIRVTEKMAVDYEWGRLLAAAFPGGRGEIKTPAQRRFLGALVDRAELWDRTFGNPQRWFTGAGLPYDRRACARRLEIE